VVVQSTTQNIGTINKIKSVQHAETCYLIYKCTIIQKSSEEMKVQNVHAKSNKNNDWLY